MTRRYSERARKNHRDGINLRIGIIRVRIAGIKKEIKLYETLSHTKFGRKVLNGIRKKLVTRNKQLDRYLTRKAKLKSTGQI